MREMTEQDRRARDEWRAANPTWCRHCGHGMHADKCQNCDCQDWDW